MQCKITLLNSPHIFQTFLIFQQLLSFGIPRGHGTLVLHKFCEICGAEKYNVFLIAYSSLSFTGHPKTVEHALKLNMDYILGITVLYTSMIL